MKILSGGIIVFMITLVLVSLYGDEKNESKAKKWTLKGDLIKAGKAKDSAMQIVEIRKEDKGNKKIYKSTVYNVVQDNIGRKLVPLIGNKETDWAA